MNMVIIFAAQPEINIKHPAIPITSPPLTPLYLKKLLTLNDIDSTILDTRFFLNDDNNTTDYKRVALELAKLSPATVLLSFKSTALDIALSVADICKRLCIKTFAGGAHINSLSDFDNLKAHFNHIVTGDAEGAVKQLLAESKPPFVIKSCPTAGKDILQVTDFDIYEQILEQFEYRCANIQLSRGCFSNCKYCAVSNNSLSHIKFTETDSEKAVAAIDQLVDRYGINYFILTDSIATASRNTFPSVISHLKEHHQHVCVQLNSSFDSFNEKTAKLLDGLKYSVWFGLESVSSDIRKFLKKNITDKMLQDVTTICKEYDINCWYNLLLGVPNETESDYEATYNFFRENEHISPNPNIFNPLPGTELYYYCLANKLIDKNKLEIFGYDEIKKNKKGAIEGIDYRLVIKYYEKLKELSKA